MVWGNEMEKKSEAKFLRKLPKFMNCENPVKHSNLAKTALITQEGFMMKKK